MYIASLARLGLCLVFVSLTVVHVIAQGSAAYMTEPSFSPDRREIAFVSGGDIWSVPVDGGSARLLVSHPATESRPMFSPDGSKLAFGSTRTGSGDIYILDLRAGSLSRLTFDDIGETLDGWSPDGKWIYFSSAARDIGYSDIYRVAPTGGTPMQVSADRYTNEYFSAPSPDGSTLAFSARGIANGQWWRHGRSHIDESEIWLKRGDAYEKVTDSASKNLWPMWGANGTRLFYVSDRSGSENIWSQTVGAPAKALTDFKDGRVLWASISSDGKQIVFERNFKIWQVSTDGGKAVQMPIMLRGAASGPLTDRVNMSTQIRELTLSPDGKKVAVVSRGEVFAASAKDGGDAVRVTTTLAPESQVAWSRDSRSLVYASERNEKMQLFQYDFGTQTETQLTTKGNDYSPVFSPDGRSIAFIRDAQFLMVYDVVGRSERQAAKFYTDAPPLIGNDSVVWSPDNKWLAFISNSPQTRSYANVWAVPASGGTAQPISFLANSNSGTVTWSPDGSYILFDTNQRTEQTSIARVDLKLRTPKFREDTFRDLFKQESPKERPQAPGQPGPVPSTIPTPQLSPAASPEAKEDDKPTQVVFEGIRERLRTLSIGLDSGGPVISPDGKTLLVIASAEGQTNIYTINIEELATDTTPRQITSTAGNKFAAQFSPDSKEVYYVESGRVMIANLDRRDSRPLNINMEMNVNFAREKMETFKQGWRYLRDNFYDEKYHGADWEAVRRTFEPVASEAKNIDELRRIMSLMVGELNASHLGVTGPSGFTPTPIGKLGVRFDRSEYESSGRLKITEIITLGPVDVARVGKVGDYLISVDGTRIEAGTNIDEVLENKVDRRVDLVFAASPDGSGRREVTVKPVSTATERNLLYRQWVAANRTYVEKNSGGRLGYVHIPEMTQPSLDQLYIDLDAQNQGREGVVIDIRNNNGGFINPYVIDILARRGYLNMTERGKWAVPGRANLGQRALERPTVLVTNQHSLSDAEDLTEGYRALKLGKVVGEPTAGWIIFTWNTGTFDGTTVRLPRQRITDSNGKDMELNPRPVDIAVTRPIGETYTGKDSQLDAAIRSLLGDLGKSQSFADSCDNMMFHR
jgi:tricorn protease